MNNVQKTKTILVTGGAGYVGAVLIPKLLKKNYFVKVYDLMMYGEDVFDGIQDKSKLEIIKADLRDKKKLKESLNEVDVVIHLACISNDPSFDLNPNLGKSINLDAFEPLVQFSKELGVKRFIYASSSSVYGVKEEPNVTEDMSLEPLTDYSKFKAQCEKILAQFESPEFTTVTIRPATVCGYSPRQRFDLIVNILTNHGFNNHKILINGGDQKRPNIHIEDMTDLYVDLIEIDKNKIAGKIFNAGYENHTVTKLANLAKEAIGGDIKLEVVPTDDNRSYHVSSEKLTRELGFKTKKTIQNAIEDLVKALREGKFEEPLTNKKYFNIKTMKDIGLI